MLITANPHFDIEYGWKWETSGEPWSRVRSTASSTSSTVIDTIPERMVSEVSVLLWLKGRVSSVAE